MPLFLKDFVITESVRAALVGPNRRKPRPQLPLCCGTTTRRSLFLGVTEVYAPHLPSQPSSQRPLCVLSDADIPATPPPLALHPPLCGCWVVWYGGGCDGSENELIPVTRRRQRFSSLSTSGWSVFAGKLIKTAFAADTQRADESGEEAWNHLYHPPELRLFPFRRFHSRSLSGRERATHTTTKGVEL